AVMGMLGDLVESMVKRSSGVKDSSHLIPGHGGVLDRFDAVMFAAPAVSVYLRWVVS
ncbi:MAG: phosphatidate cytidylyltransferase, partial [Myxococcota bacterium]